MIRIFSIIFLLLLGNVYAETTVVDAVTKNVQNYLEQRAKEDPSNCGINGNFSDIKCPEKEGYQTTLIDISYSRGVYTCKYATPEGVTETATKKIGCVDKYKGNHLWVFGKDILLQELKRYSDIVFKEEKNISDHFIGSTKLEDKFDTYKIMNELYTYSKKRQERKEKPVQISFDKPDSHSHSDKTLGGIIIGTFTLDPDFFEPGFINQLGQIQLKPEYLNVELSDTEIQVWDYIKSIIFNPITEWSSKVDINNNIKAGEMNTVDPLSFMDRQVLGFLVYTGISFKQAFTDMVFLALGLSVFWSMGYYTYKKGMALQVKKDEFNIDKASWLMSASMATLFFIAPVINDGEISGYIKDDIYYTAYSSENETMQNWSSPAQEMLRQFLQEGNYFGNLLSDYGMFSYLRFIAYKQGLIDDPKQVFTSTVKTVEEIDVSQFGLAADVSFYNNICRKYFPNVVGSMVKTHDVAVNNTDSHPDNGVLEDNKIGSDRMSFQACMSLEKSIYSNTNKIVAQGDMTKENIKNLDAIYNDDKDARENFQRFMNTMVFTQNRFGWIDAPIVPISYFFFKNSSYFAFNNKIQTENTKAFSDSVKNFNSNDVKKDAMQRVSEEMGDWTVAGLGLLIENSFWFVIPGFDGIYKNISGSLEGMYISRIHMYNQKYDDSDPSNMLKRAVNFLSGLVGGVAKIVPIPMGKLVAVLAEVAEKITDQKKSTLVVLLIKIISIYFAVILMTMVVEAITITAIAVFLAIKITLYMLEVLFFYFAAPAIGLFYALINNQQSKNFVGHFFKSVAVLAITPSLFVMTTYLIIASGEFMELFFMALVDLFTAVMQTGSQDLYSSAQGMYVMGVIKKSFMIAMVKGIAATFAHFAVLAIATIMIFNFRDWYTKFTGIESAINIMKEGGQEVKQNVNRYINPVQ